MLILRERLGNIEVLTLNRPEAANSLNPPLMEELGLALQEILDDDDVRAVVLTGAGERIFCAGMDLERARQLERPHRRPVATVPGPAPSVTSWTGPIPSH